MFQIRQGHNFQTHSQNITQPSVAPEPRSVPLLFCLHKQELICLAEGKSLAKNWRKAAGSSYYTSPICFHLGFKLLETDWWRVFQERQPLNWVSMSQVPTIAYLCYLLQLWVDKLKVQNRCHLYTRFCLSKIFPCMANGNNDLQIWFQKIPLKWKSHRTDGILSLCP